MVSTKDASVAEQEHKPEPSQAEVETAIVHAGEDSTGMKDHWKCLTACTLMSMCPFQYGIDFGCISGLQAMNGFLKVGNLCSRCPRAFPLSDHQVFGYEDTTKSPPVWELQPDRQQLISSLMILGAFVSSGLAGPIAAYISRRLCIWIAIVLCIISNVIMMTANSIGALYAGRLLIGLANGMLMTFSQLYIQEVAPAKYRGMMISAFQVWTSIGSLVGTIVDNSTASIVGRNSYLIPLGIVYIVPGLLFIALFLIPESPRWLMDQGKYAQARTALRWLRPYSDDVVEAEASAIQDALEAEKALHNGISIIDLVRDPVDRRRTVLAVAALSTQGASGAMYMIAYGTYFFREAGIDKPFQNACILTGLGVFIILVNSAVITRIGRRRVFLMTGMTICGFSQLFSAIIYSTNPGSPNTGKGVVAFAVIYILGYNVSFHHTSGIFTHVLISFVLYHPGSCL